MADTGSLFYYRQTMFVYVFYSRKLLTGFIFDGSLFYRRSLYFYSTYVHVNGAHFLMVITISWCMFVIT